VHPFHRNDPMTWGHVPDPFKQTRTDLPVFPPKRNRLWVLPGSLTMLTFTHSFKFASWYFSFVQATTLVSTLSSTYAPSCHNDTTAACYSPIDPRYLFFWCRASNIHTRCTSSPVPRYQVCLSAGSVSAIDIVYCVPTCD
jgi:hypothetical protein